MIMGQRQFKDSGAFAHKTLDVPLEFKDLSDTGTFSGYASIFGNVDFGGDIVERGAFEEIVKTKDGQVRVLLQHDVRKPIGKATVQQDDNGLKFHGSLVLANGDARSTYELMKQGILDGMSIGFDILPNGSEDLSSGNRKLTRLKLWEISVVTFGMNAMARIDQVKNAVNCNTIREFEDFLRDVGGYSNSQAKLLASGGWKALQSARDETEGEKAAAQNMLSFLRDVSSN